MFVDVALASGTFVYEVPTRQLTGEQKIAPGLLVNVPLKTRKLEGWIVGVKKTSSLKNIKQILSIPYPEPLITPQLLELSNLMAGYYQSSLGSVLNAMVPPRGTIGSKKWEVKNEKWGERNKSVFTLPSIISKSLRKNKFESVLLYGSQRNAIYLKAIKEALSYGRGVIFLVPEILLTSSMFALIQKEFGNLTALLHSKLRKEDRWIEWLRIKQGIAKIVVGTKSAIFAPVYNLGLIIIDNEQDTSYKSLETPKYSARTVALMRAKLESSLCILGTSIPSIETLYNAEIKEISLLRLTHAKKLPKIWLVDMRRETDPIFSELLKRKLTEHLKLGEKIILFLNRRGFCSFILCEDCGYIPRCPNCGISLTYYKETFILKCHYCGYTEKAPGYCEQCKGTNLLRRGIGISRVEKAFKALFPNVNILRLDLDSVSKRYVIHAFESFKKGTTQVLLGTQLVAKHISFPEVGLVGIISADTGLNRPDFRTSEYTFALLTQLIEKGEEVVLQTYNPKHSVLTHIINHNYSDFCESEKLIRKELNYPPYSHLIRILVEGFKKEKVKKEAMKIADKLREQNINFLGPVSCLLEKKKGKSRMHLLLKVKNPLCLKRINIIFKNAIVDVDTIDLL
ncbi:primosomal protein N' [candidate division WOR-3 bacterium]|nr:primosomal protein N' [candidate division WOR-3 bacterium]